MFFDLIQRQDVPGALAALAERPSWATARDTYLGSTPLHFAAHRGLTPLVEALLAAGADPDALEDASQSTALHWAAVPSWCRPARPGPGRRRCRSTRRRTSLSYSRR